MEKYLIEKILPCIQADGGHFEFVYCEDGIVNLTFRGECSKCDKLDRCCKWIEERIKTDLGEEVRITAARRKPWFQDK